MFSHGRQEEEEEEEEEDIRESSVIAEIPRASLHIIRYTCILCIQFSS